MTGTTREEGDLMSMHDRFRGQITRGHTTKKCKVPRFWTVLLAPHKKVFNNIYGRKSKILY